MSARSHAKKKCCWQDRASESLSEDKIVPVAMLLRAAIGGLIEERYASERKRHRRPSLQRKVDPSDCGMAVVKLMKPTVAFGALMVYVNWAGLAGSQATLTPNAGVATWNIEESLRSGNSTGRYAHSSSAQGKSSVPLVKFDMAW